MGAATILEEGIVVAMEDREKRSKRRAQNR